MVFQPANRDELQTAVNLWIVDTASALVTYGDINTWVVGSITDMSNLFKDKTTFNSDISNWNMTHVENMSGMFEGAAAFNQNIRAWKILATPVVNMSGMFLNATAMDSKYNGTPGYAATPMVSFFNYRVRLSDSISLKTGYCCCCCSKKVSA